MLDWIVAWRIKLRLLVTTLAVAMIVIGINQLRNMPVDILPEFAPSYIEVQTEAPGLSVTEVEELVTFNLEALLSGLPWLQSIRSTSIPGLSSIILTFKRGTDIIRARQLVSERMGLAYTLPNVALSPIIMQPLSATSRVMMIGLSSKQVSLIEMSLLAHWNIRPALLSIPGVANIAIWGMRDKQLQVLVDPKKLLAKNITLEQIISTTGNTFWVSPLSFLNASTPGSGGWIETPQQRLEIRHILPISSPNELAQVNIEGTTLQLGDITHIVEGHPPLIGDDIIDNGSGLLIVIDKFPSANTLDLTKEIEQKLAELKPGLSDIQVDTTIFRPAGFVQMTINNLSTSLLAGFVLLIIVLFTFLYNWRAVLISLIAITTSLILAVLMLAMRGETMNTMVVAGLIMAIAIVVDEAIIEVEAASIQTRSGMMYAMFILLLMLLPFFFLNGISGVFFQPLVMSYAFALIASMVVALIVTPALYLLFFSKTPIKARESRLMPWLRHHYIMMLRWVIQRTSAAFLTVGAIVISIIVSTIFIFLISFRGSLIPAFNEPNILIQWEGPNGTSATEMTRITKLVSRELKSIQGVLNVTADIGRAVLGDHIVDVNSSELIINLNPEADYDSTVAAIRKVVSGYPGMFYDVSTYLNGKIRQALTGSNSDIVIRIFGPEYGILYSKALEVKEALNKIKGTSNVHIEQQIKQPQITIKVDLTKAKHYGVKPGDVRRAVSTYIAGIEVGTLFQEQKVFQVEVWGTPEVRHSLNSVRNLLINTPSGKTVSLTEIADVNIAPTLNFIQHEAISRLIDIGLNVKEKHDFNTIDNNIKESLNKIKFPLEYHVKVLETFQEQNMSRYYFLIIWLAAAIVIVLLLQAAFSSWQLAFALFFALPSALIGGELVAFMMSSTSLTSLFGLLVVLGITLRNSLLLIKHYQNLLWYEKEKFGIKLILRGAQERSVSILISAFAIILVLAPLAFYNIPGQEIASPMARIIISCLLTSMIFTLFIVPSLFLWLGINIPNQAVQMELEEP